MGQGTVSAYQMAQVYFNIATTVPRPTYGITALASTFFFYYYYFNYTLARGKEYKNENQKNVSMSLG